MRGLRFFKIVWRHFKHSKGHSTKVWMSLRHTSRRVLKLNLKTNQHHLNVSSLSKDIIFDQHLLVRIASLQMKISNLLNIMSRRKNKIMTKLQINKKNVVLVKPLLIKEMEVRTILTKPMCYRCGC